MVEKCVNNNLDNLSKADFVFLFDLNSVGCEPGKYGMYCTKKCDHCKDNSSCGQVYGKCNDEGCAYPEYQKPNCQSE